MPKAVHHMTWGDTPRRGRAEVEAPYECLGSSLLPKKPVVCPACCVLVSQRLVPVEVDTMTLDVCLVYYVEAEFVAKLVEQNIIPEHRLNCQAPFYIDLSAKTLTLNPKP